METMEQNDVVNLHLNMPQLLFELAKCRNNICVWGRRTGKTEGPMASFTLDNILDMPRSNGFLVGRTYEQILTRTLPPLIAAWERRGFRQNEHFWVRKYAPERLNLPRAYRSPITPDHYIHFFNGSGIYLVSQDRPGTINGVATQWGAGDEAKFLDYEKLQEEALLTLSGEYHRWGDKWNYLSTLFCSDMPTNTAGRWLIDSKNEMNPEAIKMILGIQSKIQEYVKLIDSGEYSEKTENGYRARIRELDGYVNELKKSNTYYSMASTFDNIHVLGLDVLKNFFRQLDGNTFLTSVANEYVAMIKNCFYASLNPFRHGEDSIDYGHVDTVVVNVGEKYNRDCRWDADLDPHLPLDISCDFNNAINCVVTGQQQAYKNQNRFCSSLYVLHPLLLGDMVDKWHEYYQYRSNRDVNFIHDQTAIGGKADSDVSYADQWIEKLTKKGWNVRPVYIGAAPTHRARYYIWNKVLRERDGLPLFRYNKEACADWQVSCERAGVIQSTSDRREFKKDKRSERDKKIPANESTHLSEAGDILFWYWYKSTLENTPEFVDMMLG